MSILALDRTGFPDDGRREPGPAAVPRLSAIAEALRLDPKRVGPDTAPPPARAYRPWGAFGSLLLHLLPLLLLIGWPRSRIDITTPIPIQLVIVQPPPPPPPPPERTQAEAKPPPRPPARRLSSDNMAETAGPDTDTGQDGRPSTEKTPHAPPAAAKAEAEPPPDAEVKPAPAAPPSPPAEAAVEARPAAEPPPPSEARPEPAPEPPPSPEPPRPAGTQTVLVAPPLPPPPPVPLDLPAPVAAPPPEPEAVAPPKPVVAKPVVAKPAPPKPPPAPRRETEATPLFARLPLPLPAGRQSSVRTARLVGPAAERDAYCAEALALTLRHINLLPRSLTGARHGETLLKIVVLGDGTINGIRVARSSGYSDIDERVEQMVIAVRRFPPLPPWMGSPTEFTFSLHFPHPLQR